MSGVRRNRNAESIERAVLDTYPYLCEHCYAASDTMGAMATSCNNGMVFKIEKQKQKII